MAYEIMKEAETFYFPGNSVGVLVIHGFTGTTQSMHYLGEKLSEAGFTVYGPRLMGHGTVPEDMEKASYQDWIKNVEEALNKLKETCSDIFVSGLSMGGTLTLYLAENYPDIKGIMPINAAIYMPEMIKNYEKLSKDGTRFVQGIGSDIKQAGIQELAYKKTPVKSMLDIITLSENVRSNLSKITTPALIFKSKVDHVVPPENSDDIYASISSEIKRIVKLENSYHVATLDTDKAMIAEECKAFIMSKISI